MSKIKSLVKNFENEEKFLEYMLQIL
jgi:hypothetical protein